MMRVLEEKVWKIQTRCTGSGNGGNGCGSLLEVELDDLRLYSGARDYGGNTIDDAVSFRCPCCSQLTDIASAMWPANHKRRLKPFSSVWKDTGVDDPDKINAWIVETT